MDTVGDNFISKYVVNSSQKDPFHIQPVNPRVSELHLLYTMISCLPKIYFNITLLQSGQKNVYTLYSSVSLE